MSGVALRITEVWLRFYKSFNFDYELKATPGARRLEWQDTPDGWLPHIRVGIEPDITAVVGANESGKTHLLDAIKIVLTGEGLLERDFCRSSALFSVEQGSRLYPEVGATFAPSSSLTTSFAEAGIPLRDNGTLLMLRPRPGQMDVIGSDDRRATLTGAQAELISAALPHPYEMQTEVALPDSVSIASLAGVPRHLAGRRNRSAIWDLLAGLSSAEDATRSGPSIFSMIGAADSAASAGEQLGVDLLKKVARIDESSFVELRDAIANEREGLVNGLIQEMNNSLARHLNVSRWWSQDPEFQLRVSPREHELVFTIRDRTGTDYSFTERSRGLRYFLSYYVQLLSHDRPLDRPEVLLMDEPDAYLSASGQQDLLRVLEHHARPESSDRQDQVVYVTHSPFLINRNAGHRVRVLDKGARDEGTRLVKDATRNHYEPLRTSLGSFVAETAFIGGDNLFVEGISDQVYLAGMNARLLRLGAAPSSTLDLNQATIVPGGSNIPYMLYLARGRDQYKPACAALLDGDQAGLTAREQIRRGGARGRPTISDDLVVVLSEWAVGAELSVSDGVVVREPEDLIPVGVAISAARRYAQVFLGLGEPESRRLKEAAVVERLSGCNGSLWDALSAEFTTSFEADLGKAGFAKELLALLEASEAGPRPAGVPALDDNFGKLLDHLAEVLQRAQDRENESRRGQRLDRLVDGFIADHPTGCLRDRANTLLRRIDSSVDDTSVGDVIRAATARIRRQFKLANEPLKNVGDYETFLDEIRALRHLERLHDQGVIAPPATKS